MHACKDVRQRCPIPYRCLKLLVQIHNCVLFWLSHQVILSTFDATVRHTNIVYFSPKMNLDQFAFSLYLIRKTIANLMNYQKQIKRTHANDVNERGVNGYRHVNR